MTGTQMKQRYSDRLWSNPATNSADVSATNLARRARTRSITAPPRSVPSTNDPGDKLCRPDMIWCSNLQGGPDEYSKKHALERTVELPFFTVKSTTICL